MVDKWKQYNLPFCVICCMLLLIAFVNLVNSLPPPPPVKNYTDKNKLTL